MAIGTRLTIFVEQRFAFDRSKCMMRLILSDHDGQPSPVSGDGGLQESPLWMASVSMPLQNILPQHGAAEGC